MSEYSLSSTQNIRFKRYKKLLKLNKIVDFNGAEIVILFCETYFLLSSDLGTSMQSIRTMKWFRYTHAIN